MRFAMPEPPNIAAARREAADAASKLANAEQRLAIAQQRLAESDQREAAAEARLNAIKTPRSLMETEKLVDALKPFSGTRFTLNVFADAESIKLSVVVARVLEAAGWIRQQPTRIPLGGGEVMRITFDEKKEAEYILACVDTGINVHISEMETLTELQARPFPSLPKTLRAGVVLNTVIGSSIAPADENNVGKDVLNPKPSAESFTICVGRKP